MRSPPTKASPAQHSIDRFRIRRLKRIEQTQAVEDAAVLQVLRQENLRAAIDRSGANDAIPQLHAVCARQFGRLVMVACGVLIVLRLDGQDDGNATERARRTGDICTGTLI
jgi:hypothetical protein